MKKHKMLNKVCLQGNLGADPELKITSGGLAHTRVSVAVRRNYKNADGTYEADWVECSAFRKTAEFLCKYFRKGDMVVIDGSLRSSSYTNSDGGRSYRLEVLVDAVNFCGTKGNVKEAHIPDPPSEPSNDDNDDYPF